MLKLIANIKIFLKRCSYWVIISYIIILKLILSYHTTQRRNWSIGKDWEFWFAMSRSSRMQETNHLVLETNPEMDMLCNDHGDL